MTSIRLSILLLTCCIFETCVVAQEYLDRQELLKQLSNTMQDTNRVLLYIDIGQQYENNIPDSAIYYYVKARDLSKKLNYHTGTLKYFSNITYVLNAQSKYDSALQLNLQSVELAKTHGTPRQLAACLGNVANSYLYLEKYEQAVDYFLQVSDIIGKSGNKQYQCVLFNNLAVVYNKLKQPEKAREYAESAVSLARETDDVYNLGVSLDNLALTLISSGKYQEALSVLKEGLKVTDKTDNIYAKESILINLADCHRRLGQFDEIKAFAEEGLELSQKLQDIAGEATAYLSLGYYHFYRNELDQATRYALLSEKTAASVNLLEVQGNAVGLLGNIALQLKNYKQYQKYQTHHDSLENLTVNERIIQNIQELEAKYETEKKVQQINQLEQEKAIQDLKLKQNRFVLITLSGILFTILAVSILLIRNYRQKQLIYKQEKELQNRRIAELETEKLLTAAEAALKGQDEERTRLARDLHDSLGGMLSGIKLSFINLKETLAKDPDDIQKFDRNLDMLDGSIIELRKVAHNLMPEILLKFGLDTALRDYCEKISESGTVNISYQTIGFDHVNFEQSSQITIYRIIQELINNILKHAEASQVFVQLAHHDGLLSVSVEDNGKGLDVEAIENSPGIGWRNIKNRIDFLKGSIDIQSERNKGTTVNIELKDL